jgi:hypothetical protein
MKELAITFPGGTTVNPTTGPTGGLSFLSGVLGQALTIFMMLGLMLVAVYFVWGATQWAGSGGDKAKIAAGRNRITYAIIGFILVLLSYFVITAIGFLFNVDDVLRFPT